MNSSSTMHGGRRSGWPSKVEDTINRAADTLMEGVESFSRELERLWASLTRHLSRKRA